MSFPCATVCRRNRLPLGWGHHGGKPCELHIGLLPRCQPTRTSARLGAVVNTRLMVAPSRSKPWHTYTLLLISP